MTLFYNAVDDACDERTSTLKRNLFWDEVRLIEDTLFLEWLNAGRFDDLIDHALDEYDIQDGEAFCASLSEVLAKAGDRTRFERLFLGLTKTREAAFWRAWPKAQEGHIGAMKETARHLANALEAMAGLYHCYWVVTDEAGMESVKINMLRLQARQKPARPKRGPASGA
jgi:hypothetical protein